jgi:hypothetical protein
MSETWRIILDGNYEVSDLGNVRRATPGRRTSVGRPMRLVKMAIGYMSVAPTINGRNVTKYVHELVAEAFLGPRPNGMSVNHIDGDKTNNRIENLEYVTHAENMAHAARAGLMVRGERHPNAKLSDSLVETIRVERAAGASVTGLALTYGVAPSTISQICSGQRRRT